MTNADRVRRWRLRHPEKWKAAQRRAYEKRKSQYYTKVKAQRKVANYTLKARLRSYGLTVHEFEAMLTNQHYKCACCGDPITAEKSHIDHDHKTEQVRSVLCVLCNSGLGLFKDNPARLRAAATYIEHHANKT